MTAGLESRLRRMGYTQARLLLLGTGLGVLILITAVMYVRRVDTVEVVATLLFIPVFLAFVFFSLPGGLFAGAVAGAVYAALRYPAIDAVGFGSFSSLIVTRSIAYLLFGAIGGIANGQLRSSLRKLDLYDQIDDETGLFNARFFVQDTDLEMSRSRRYQTIFSISAVDFPISILSGLGLRRRNGLLRDVGRLLRGSVRTVDRAVHARDASSHRIAVVLPETGREGARVFTERLASELSSFLAQRGADAGDDGVRHASFTYPDDETPIQRLRTQFTEIDHAEHPEPASGQR